MTEFTYENVNSYAYKSMLSHGSVFIDGFRDDYFWGVLQPEYFGPSPTRPAKEIEKLLRGLEKFFSRCAWLDILSGKSYICQAIEGEETVATCLLDYPIDQRPKLSIWQRVKYYYYFAYVGVANFLDGNPQKKLLTSEVSGFFNDMYKLAGAIQKKEYYDKLSELSYQQLTDALYPIDKTLYVHLLAVRRSGQGKGYGNKLLRHSLSMFKECEQVFKGPNGSSVGPCKASLYPTKDNETFYERYGFKGVSEAPCKLTEETTHTFQFMQRVL